jgi:uncharacterized membrane protein YfcA
MQIQDQNREQSQSVSTSEQLFLFIGFVTFITGLFTFGYALLASILLPFSKSVLVIALGGLIGAYAGGKILKYNRKEITL